MPTEPLSAGVRHPTMAFSVPTASTPTPFAVLRDDEPNGPPRWLAFDAPDTVMSCRRPQEVPALLQQVDTWWRQGHWAVGLLTYEAAAGFDPALVTHPPGPMPVAWWARCRSPKVHLGSPPLAAGSAPLPPLDWQAGLHRNAYRQALATIRDHIAAGDTYQVNYTFPLGADFDGRSEDLFLSLHRAQPAAAHSAYLDLGRFVVCSVSPELFFSQTGQRILTRPMKGTAARGRFPREDARQAASLLASAKDRAENVMIVDMMRNDLGKVAHPGSVRVEDLFSVETHPTVHQMTSTIAADSAASLPELMAALFPCASITGAPKVRTMAIVRQLETTPRGIYTGSLGFLSPAGPGRPRRASFNVAIRTALVDRHHRRVHFGTGGGIVWDSDPESEYEECRTKTRILRSPPPFSLIETLRWRPTSGYRRFEQHFRRLLASARHFGFTFDPQALRQRLCLPPGGQGGLHLRVRWSLHRDGRCEVESFPFAVEPRRRWTLRLDDRPVDASNPFLFHKTTHRRVYDEARQRHPGVDEVVLWNERRELTEGLRTNLVLRLGKRWWTPRQESGLLAGVMRQCLIGRGRLQEATLPVEALTEADDIYLINSLRGILEGRLLPPTGCPAEP